MKKKMSNEEYHAHGALGSSGIKYCLTSMAKFKAYLDGLIDPPVGAALDFGTMAHEIVLEDKEDQYVSDALICAQAIEEYASANDGKRTKNVRNTKIYKELVSNEIKTIVNHDDYLKVMAMKAAFKNHGLAPNICKDGEAEASYFTTIHEVEYKARADYYVKDDAGDYIVDYKTMSGDDFDDIQKAIYKRRYDIQAAHYMRVVSDVEARSVADFMWIFQEKTAPYECVVVRASNEMIDRATAKLDELYTKISEAKFSDVYESKFAQEVVEMDLPYWAIKLEEGDE